MAFWNLGSWADLLFSPSRPKSAHPRAKSRQDRPGAFGRRLGFEMLESRQMMSVNFGTIQNVEVPGSKTVLVPLSASDSGSAQINYTFDPVANLQMELLSQSSKSLKLHIQASNGATFSGDLILHLFEDLAPTTTARIEDLVNQGYYNGLDFFRVFDGFMSQGGRKSSDPSTEQLDDELNSSLTFTSRGLLAMANAGDDTSTAEFFITAIDAAGSTNPIGVAAMPQFLNFDFTIFGQLVSGFDLFQQIMSTPTQDQTVAGQPEHSDPLATITITSAQIITDTQNAVLKITPQAGFTGTANIEVTAHGGGGATANRSFTATAITDPDPSAHPFINTHIEDQDTEIGEAVNLTLSSTNPSGGGVVYKLLGTSDAANALVNINSATGAVTITPVGNFVGEIGFKIGVRDASLDDGTNNSNFQDSETFFVTWSDSTLRTLSGVAYVDKNSNGVNDAGDIPLSGVLITLVGPDSVSTRTTATASNGSYSFAGVAQGTYTLRESQPTKLKEGTTVAGSLGGDDSVANIISNIVVAGADGTGYNFTEGKLAANKVSINMFLASTPTDQQSYSASISSSTTATVNSIVRASTNPSSATSVNFTVHFNRAVTGVNAADFSVLMDGVTGASITSVTGSGSTYTVTVNTGTGTGTLGIKLLDDDSITDSAGNRLGGTGAGNGTFVSEFYTINKVAAVKITDAPTINLANVSAVVVKGTGQPGRTVSIVFTDAQESSTPAVTATVASDGTWTSPPIDASNLVDSTTGEADLKVKASQVDSTGATSNDQKVVVKDTEGSQPTFTDSSIPQFINSTNVNAITATGFADDVNARIVIQVHLNGQLVKSYETVASFDPQLDKAPWSKLLDGLSDVNDGTLEFTITAIDPSGNSGQLPVFTRIKDTFIALDFTVTPGTTINASQVNAVTVSGTSSEGSAPFDLLVRDGVVAHDITVHIVPDAQGNWSTDPIAGLSGLNQGNITFTATISDNHENSKTTSKTVLLDTIAPEDSVLDDPAPIDLNNQGSYEVTGTGEPGATVDVRVIGGGADGPFHTTVGQDHKWKVSNLSVGGRLDGTVTIEATFKDAAGNTTQITKTTTKNTVLVNMVTDPIDLTNYNNVTVSGTGQNGAVVTLIVRDQFNTPLPGSAPSTTIAGGTWSFTGIDLSTLSDGNTTFTANAILSGHQGSSNKIVEKRTVRIGSIATINSANASSLAVSGTGQVGAKVTVKAEEANNAADFVTSNQVTVLANGTWNTTVDVSGLSDGDLKFTATATDEAVPTPHTATSVKTATKDTVVETSTATVPAAFDSSNENSFTITGTSEKGSTVKLVITDGANHTVTPTSVTVNAQGQWTFTGVDVHTLDDGNLKFDFTFTDPFGNEFILPTINRTKS